MKQFFAGLFGKKKDEGDDGESRITTVRSRPAAVTTASKTVDSAGAVKPLALAAVETPRQHSPQLQWVTGPGVSNDANSAAPLPRSRPANSAIASLTSRQLASAGDVTAALPAAITGNSGLETKALGYAPADSFIRGNTQVTVPTVQQPAPLPTPRGRVIGPAPVVNSYADAANAPVSLLSGNQIQFSVEMRQPNHSTAMTLVEPIHTALSAQFGSNPAELPAMSRFAGPAVVALPTVIFGREAALRLGRQAFQAN